MYTAGFVVMLQVMMSTVHLPPVYYVIHIIWIQQMVWTTHQKKKKKKSKMTQIATPQAIEKQLNDSGYHTTD